MITKHVQVDVVQGDDLQLVIQIREADRIENVLLALSLDAAQKLVEDLTCSVETIESLLASPEDHTH
jgi:hypothetical protein